MQVAVSILGMMKTCSNDKIYASRDIPISASTPIVVGVLEVEEVEESLRVNSRRAF